MPGRGRAQRPGCAPGGPSFRAGCSSIAASKVRLIPASPGTGVVAGTVVRAILELAGVKDCLTKCYGSTNPENILKAAMAAIGQLQTPEKIAGLRGLKLERTLIEDKIEKGKAYAPAASDAEKKVRGPVNTLGSERRGRRGGPGGMSRRDRQATRDSGDTPPAAPGAAPAAPTK